MDRDLQSELNKRDKRRYLEELNELESSLASTQRSIFWVTLNLLIIEPAITAGTAYYFWDKLKTAMLSGTQIANWTDFLKSIKWAGIFIAFAFLSSSLTLLWYLWKASSLQREIARTRAKISRLE